jgi:hypothetical protein
MFDCSKILNISQAWRECTKLASFPLIDTSNCVSISSGWNTCGLLSSFPLLNVSKVTDAGAAWFACGSLKNFPALNFTVGTNFATAWRGMGTGVTFAEGFYVGAGVNFSEAFRDTVPTFAGSNNIGLQLGNMTNGTTCFNAWNATTPGVAYFSQFLNDLRSVTSKTNVTLHCGTATYNSGASAARASLVSDGWVITSGAMV